MHFENAKKKSPGIRFRRYLVRSLDYFLIDWLRRAKRQPKHVPIDDNCTLAEAEHNVEVDQFDMDWANHLINLAVDRVKEDCLTSDQLTAWQIFKARVVDPFLTGAEPPSYDELVTRLNLATPKQASNRLITGIRKFNRILRQLVSEYVSSDADPALVEAELSDLRRILARPGAIQLHNKAGGSTQDSVFMTGQNIFDVSVHADEIWSADELAQIWEHLNTSSLDDVLHAHCPQIAVTYAGLTVLDGHALASLRDLWQHPQPPLDLVQALKHDAKHAAASSNDRPHGNGLPRPINGAIYTLCVAAAWLQRGHRITRESDARFRSNLEFVIKADWTDETAKALAQQWLDQIV